MPGPGDDIFKKLANATKEDTHGVDSGTSITGLSSGGSPDLRGVPEYYEKMGKKLGWSPFDLPENLERVAHINQPLANWYDFIPIPGASSLGNYITGEDSALGNMRKGFVKQAATGFVDSIAAWDLKGLSDMAQGRTESEYGNWLNDITKKYRESIGNEDPIYTDGDRMDSVSYWLKQGQQLGYSGGIILETIAEQTALGYLTGGSGNMASLASKGRLLKNLGHATFGMWKGVQEGYMNGLETLNNVYNKYKDLGYSEEESKTKAAQAATLGYRMEVGPLMALNALQFATIGAYNPFARGGASSGYSGAFESVVDRLIPNVTNKFAKKALGYGINMVSEGVEEGIQTGASKYAQYQIDSKSKTTGGKTLGDYLWDTEMRDSIVGGMLGGAMFKGAFDAYNYFTKNTESKQYSQAHDNFIRASRDRVQDDLNTLREALETGDKNIIRRQRNVINSNNTLAALRLDYINNKETAFDSHINQMQDVLDNIDSKNLEILKGYGLETEQDFNYVKQYFPQYIEDAKKIKENLVKNLDKSITYDIAEKLTAQEQNIDSLVELKNSSNMDMELDKQNDKRYQSLNPLLKEYFDMKNEFEAFSLHKESNLLPYQKTQLENLKERITQFEKDNKETLGKESLDIDNSEYIKYLFDIQKIQQHLENSFKEFDYLKNINNQKAEVTKRTQEKLNRTIENSNNSEELKKLKEEAEKNNVLDEKSKEVINDKIEISEVREKNNNVPDIVPVNEDIPVTQPSTERTNSLINISEVLDEEGNKIGDVIDYDSLFEPLNVSDAHSDLLKSKVKDNYNSIENEIGRKPSFTEFIKDSIQNIGKENTEKIFNGLVKGWELNNYTKEDFNKVYKDFFLDRKQSYLDILQNLEDTLVPNTPEEVINSTEQVLKEVVEEKSDIVQVDLNTNQPILEDTNPFKTSNTELRASFLSIGFTRNIDENGLVSEEDTSDDLLNSSDINSKKLLDPELFNEGTSIEVRIPENFGDIIISTWEDDITKGKSMTFGDWVRKNNIEIGSEEYISKIPMIAYDTDNEGVFFIHDTQWYNPINVGLKDNPQEQFKVIKEARSKTLEFRKEVFTNKNVNVTITKKRPGTWKTIPETSPLITINEANPDTILAIANDNNELVVDGKVFDKKIIKNESKRFKRGNTYQIRRSTNKDEYLAFEVQREKLDTTSVNTLKQAVRVYLLQKDKTNTKIQEIRNQVLSITNYDLFNREDFQKFLNLYVATIDRSIKSISEIKEIANNYKTYDKEGNVKMLPDGTPYFTVQKGNFVFGSVRTAISGSNEFLYLHPDKVNDIGGITTIESMLKSFDKIASNITQNISKEGLELNRSMVSIDEQGQVVPLKNYQEHLKNSLKTNVKSFNIGNENKPNYVTIIQPVIEFSKTEQNVKEQSKDIVTKEDVKIEELRKKFEELPDDLLYITHITFDGNAVNIFDSKLIVGADLSTTTGIVTKDKLFSILSELIKGNSPHRNYFDMFIGAIDRKTLEQERGKLLQDKLQEYITENFIDDVSKMLLPKELNFGYFTEGVLHTNKSIKEENISVQENVQNIELLKETLKQLRELGVGENDPAILVLKEQLGEDSSFEPIDYTDEQVRAMKETFTGTEGLSILQDSQIVDFIFNSIGSKLNFEKGSSVNKKDILQSVRESYMSIIEPKQDKNNQLIDSLTKVYQSNIETNKHLKVVIETLQEQGKVFNNIKEQWKNLESKGLKKVYKYTGITETEDIIDDFDDNSNQVEKNHSKISLEENGKDSASYRLKRFFSSILQVKSNGELKTGFLGVPLYVGFDVVYSTIEQIISSPYEVDSDFNLMLARLEENTANYPWLRQTIDKLKNSSDQIKNEFLYNFTRHTLSMKFIMFSQGRDGSWTLKVYDTNSNEITRVIREQWKSNFKNTSLVYIENGEYKINKERAKFLLEQFDNFSSTIKENLKTNKNITLSNKDLQNWLGNFGIYLSEETLNDLKSKQIEYVTAEGKKKYKFEQYFEKSSNTAGIFGLLADYLENIILQENTEFEENENNHPFKNANNVLKTLSRIESKYSLFATTNSFRDGDKSIYGFTPTKYATDAVKKLKFDQEYRNTLMQKSFNKNSYLLDLLNKDENFREKFYVDHIGNTALKEQGKKFNVDNSITDLNNSDHELTKLGLFQDIEQGKVKKYLGQGNFIQLRMARMFFPTMSDKSQMLDLFTAVMDLKTKHFNEDLSLKDELKNVIYSQIVKPELERIHKFSSQIKETNIEGYDIAAQMFLMLPEINNIIDPESGKRLISLMANDPTTYNIQWFEDTFKESKIYDIIENTIQEKANKKVEEWLSSGFVEDGTIKYLNNKYFNKFEGDLNKKIRLGALDYVINSQVTNANIFMLFAGDLAIYSQEKIKKFFQNGKAYLPKSKEQNGYGDETYSKITEDVLGVNLGKRLALLLAPGSKLANSKNEKYLQVFLKDSIDMTTNALYLIETFYGKEQSNLSKPLVNEYFKTDNEARKEEIVEQLKSSYPDISDYFEIELTDAQEYTTVSEHINVLYGQGRLSDEQYKTIKSKLELQLESENKGVEIPKDSMLNYFELKLVLQPIKPVYTGFIDDEKFDVMRMMYIKTSSFPLIPQVTKGTELDGLRQLLEKAQVKSGKFVRASYQTGNKVGANKKALSIFNGKGDFNQNLIKDLEDNFEKSELFTSSLILDRDNFRIQQDVPFKTGKRSEDVVSLGTQVLKLLFGDGVNTQEGFEYEGNILSGKDLHKEYNQVYNDYILQRKKILFKKLGVDNNGKPINKEETLSKLQDLLKREAEERGYPKQDIEALRLTSIKDSQGNIIDIMFNIPLWLSPNSNRYESLLNAIVTNKLAKIKLPGNSYVAGSEAGFKTTTSLKGISQSRIIFTSKWEGQLKAAEVEQGKLKKAQVLLPSRFRDNEGNLIEFIDKKGNINDTYVYRDENGMLRLKEDMIDLELLNVSSFRIPTSSHVSMSQVEIVGILPTEVGDLIIVPKNLTKQKGLDFDIDKENTYQLWTYLDEQGKIKILDEEGKKYLLNKADTLTYEMLNSDNSTSRLFKAMFGEDLSFTEEDFKQDKVLDSLNDKLQQKLLENKIVKIHTSVLSNPNPAMQSKINKVLSMDFAKSQADLISNTISSNKDRKNFTILDDSYQKDKMFLGASGKMGIGVYSNYVTFHSMVQQSEKNIVLKELVDKKYINKEIIIGKFKSNGLLGSLKTLDGSRNIAEVFAERQNTATDNEKEQIMGKVNINEITINVDSLLSALGFDKDILDDGRSVSIPYLFLSQPIIRELVQEIRKTKSNTATFDIGAKDKIVKSLLDKYSVKEGVDMSKVDSLLTGQILFNNLTTPSNIIQVAVLNKFLELENIASRISVVQNRLNITSSGLGKSFFETVDKYKGIQSLVAIDKSIENITSLVGDFINQEDIESNQGEKDLLEEGYLQVGEYFIKPTTPVGSMLVNTVKTGFDLWSEHFPYLDSNIEKVTSEILYLTNSEEKSSSRIIEISQQIFKEMKKYFYSSEKLGTFKGNPQQERSRLFIDSDSNTSLATYLKNILEIKDNEVINTVLKSNKLISRFQYDIQKNGLPSLVKFDNSKGESFDEDYLYNAIIELMDENKTLPKFNGQDYSTRKLASDLVAYSFLEGGIQEATQFSKYIPISLLDVNGFSKFSQMWNSKRIPDIFEKMLGVNHNSEKNTDFSRFTIQYIQNNPQKLPKVTLEDIIGNSNEIDTLTDFTIKSSVENDVLEKSQYVSIYNANVKKGFNKFQIYKKTGGVFKRIDTLGVFGLSEYNIKESNLNTIINKRNPPILNPVQNSEKEKENIVDVFGITQGVLQNTIENISKYDFNKYPQLKNIASSLLNHIPNNIEFVVEPVINKEGRRIGNGMYNTTTNRITIDNTYLEQGNNEAIAKTVLHETIHSLTKSYIDSYINKDGSNKVDIVPKEITDLVILFKEAKRKIGEASVNEVSNKFSRIKKGSQEVFTERERNVLYGLTDINEFITMIMVEPAFQIELANIKYLETSKSLLDKFFEIINNILTKVLGSDYDSNSITAVGIESVLNLIESINQTSTSQSKYDSMRNTDSSTENLLDNSNMELKSNLTNNNITDEDIKNLPTC